MTVTSHTRATQRLWPRHPCLYTVFPTRVMENIHPMLEHRHCARRKPPRRTLKSNTTLWRKGAILYVLLVEFLCLGSLTSVAAARKLPVEEAEPEFWQRLAERDLEAALSRPQNTKAARNVILFIGDGMGLSTVTAARIFKGQQKGNNGEEEVLAFENFPNVALMKTYNVDHQVPDSAATATAFLSGVKANYGTIGLNGRVPRGNCTRSKGNKVITIAELAQKAGKATGIVTSGRISHATPASLYSACPDRMWEDDSLLPLHIKKQGCIDIASQFVDEVGINFDVVLGGGRKNMMPNTTADPEYPRKSGQRRDGRNIIDEWMEYKRRSRKRVEYVWNKEQFDNINPSWTDSLLGLFEHSHMLFDVDRANGQGNEPCLADMVEKAIRIMDSNPNGFFLLVEAARIDHGHHENTARRALEETVAMEKAIVSAVDLLGTENTLFIVTADHSHPLNIGSYARRGNPILGLTDFSDDVNENGLSDVDNLPYTTLSYANGPGYTERVNLTGVDTEDRHYRQITAVPAQIVSHDGTDVPLYATGPMAHLFHTTHEQHYIFHVMKYAACLGETKHAHCKSKYKSEEYTCSSSCYKTATNAQDGLRVTENALFKFILIVVLVTYTGVC